MSDTCIVHQISTRFSCHNPLIAPEDMINSDQWAMSRRMCVTSKSKLLKVNAQSSSLLFPCCNNMKPKGKRIKKKKIYFCFIDYITAFDCVCVRLSVMSNSLGPLGIYPTRLLVHGILHARILEWAASSFSRGSSWCRDWTHVSHIAGRFFTMWATNKQWKILKELGIPQLTCLLRNLHAGQEATVRNRHGKTNWFKIGKGTWQDCILSPCLFNLHAEYIMWNAGLDEAQPRIRIAGRNINILRYTDQFSSVQSLSHVWLFFFFFEVLFFYFIFIFALHDCGFIIFFTKYKAFHHIIVVF